MSSLVAVNHQAAIELPLCKKDYDTMSEECPEIMQPLELAIDSGIEVDTIRAWIERVATDEKLAKQLINAARWYGSSRE